ncbi:MAG: Flp family type IVb pilin [Litorimonas sp.]
MQNLIKNFVNDESGATAIEYGLIAALVAVAMIAGATQLGQSIDDKFSDVADTLDTVSETAGSGEKGGD